MFLEGISASSSVTHTFHIFHNRVAMCLKFDVAIAEIQANKRIHSKVQLAQRAAALFDNEEFSDVTFLVGPDEEKSWRFPAHKLILSISSPVFEVMFTSGLLEANKHPEIPVTDVDPTAFENLLRYIYTDAVPLSSIKSALMTLYAAHKYIVTPLVNACTDYLLRMLDAKNVLEVYQCIKLYDEEDSNARLLLKCLKTIDESAESVLSSDYFQNLDHDIITMILSRDNLQVKSEITTFYAALNWAAAECRRKKVSLTPGNKRAVLGNTLFCIRFLTMTREEFLEGPATTCVLLKEEEDALDAKILGHDDIVLPEPLESRISALKRRRVKNSVFWAVYSNMLIRSRHKRSSIIFSVERNVIIVGFGLGAFADQSQGQFEESFQLRLSDMEGVVIREENFANKPFHVQSSVFPVRFSKPVCIMANKRYQATVIFLKEAEYAVMKRRADHIRSGESSPRFHFHTPSNLMLSEEKSQFAFIYYYY
uniref:BTB domain-containing protein n=1 Tax=Strigamia maritima TaxID=126957 RepID=T1JC60_STRMM